MILAKISQKDMEAPKNIVNGLEELVNICKDGEKGYEKAAKNAAEDPKNQDLNSLFIQYSNQRKQYIVELQTLITNLGGNPNQEGGLAGSFHRAWIDVKETLNGHDRYELLKSCETGEEAASETYNNFMADSFEYKSPTGNNSLYTITSGINRNYEDTGMNTAQSGNAGMSPLDHTTSLTDFGFGSSSEKSIMSSPNAPSAGTVYTRDDSSQNKGTHSSTDENPELRKIYPIVKMQIEGVQEALKRIKSLLDLSKSI